MYFYITFKHVCWAGFLKLSFAVANLTVSEGKSVREVVKFAKMPDA